MGRPTRKQLRFSDAVIEKVIQGWIDVIGGIEDEDTRSKVQQFTEDMKEQLFTAPASPGVTYPAAHNAMPVGFVEHTLRVLKYFKKLVSDHEGEFDHPVTNDDIILAALFHDMGKIGDMHHPYYLLNDSDWHIERGMYYDFSPDIEYMKIPHRSLFMLQHYGVKLPMHVYKAILLHDGPAEEGNRGYTMREGLFTLLLQHADQLAAYAERRRWKEWEEGSN